MKKNLVKQMIAGTMAAALLVANSIPVFAGAAPDGKTDAENLAQNMNTSAEWTAWKTNWETAKNDWTHISLTPGSDAAKMNFAWYTKDQETTDGVYEPTVNVELKISENQDMSNAVSVPVQQSAATTDTNKTADDTTDDCTYHTNKATAENLKANTTYWYTYTTSDGTLSTPAKFTTAKKEAFSFIYVGDPQIGSSNELKGTNTEAFYNAQSESVCSDSFNWNATLNAAAAKSGNTASFVVSAGDQIQTTKKKSPDKRADASEIEYTGYLCPEILKSLPVATTVGNHDADNKNYTYHFNTPNNSELGSNGVVGGDYWFTYNSVLFMMLNTQDTNVADHKAFIEEAVAANKDCKWRVVTLHQDIYGSAEHSNEPEITNLRYQLVPYFEANNVDVVLTGHDHAYSRSKILKGGKKTVEYDDDSFDEALDKDMDAGEDPETLTTAPGNIASDSADEADQAYLNYLNAIMDKEAVQAVKTENEAVINPSGILYMTANSSSGSKYYDLVPRMQSYIENRWQEDVPTYSVIDVTDTTFTINTYRTDNGEKIDNSLTLAKVTIDKTGLETLIASAKQNIVSDKASYTADSYKAFEQALAGAEAVLADTTAINSEVTAAIQALTAAQGALAKVSAPAAETSEIRAENIASIKDQSYTGKNVKPAVKVTVNNTTLTAGTDYTVSYSGNKKIGTAKAVITGTGKYTGTVAVSFKIVPKKITLSSVKSQKTKKAVVKFKAGKGSLSGYEIRYSTDRKFKKAKKVTTKKTTTTLKSLKKGKTYYVKVRGYKKVSKKTYYGAYSSVKSVKVK